MVHVLVAEAHAETAAALVRDLRRKGYEAEGVGTGKAALERLQNADLVLLTLNLPDIDGLEICRAVRAAGDTPLIALADGDGEVDRILALQSGADDSVRRSCGTRELIARIEAVLRRTRPHPAAPPSISRRPLHIDGRTRVVRMHERPVKVTAKEFELLYLLAANPETVLSRKELMARVWDCDWLDSSRTLDTHVSSLRAKLGAASWIITVRGVGYRFGHG
ncbi:response regulator transcription factor [Kitasatospora sp. NPDC054939]